MDRKPVHFELHASVSCFFSFAFRSECGLIKSFTVYLATFTFFLIFYTHWNMLLICYVFIFAGFNCNGVKVQSSTVHFKSRKCERMSERGQILPEALFLFLVKMSSSHKIQFQFSIFNLNWNRIELKLIMPEAVFLFVLVKMSSRQNI